MSKIAEFAAMLSCMVLLTVVSAEAATANHEATSPDQPIASTLLTASESDTLRASLGGDASLDVNEQVAGSWADWWCEARGGTVGVVFKRYITGGWGGKKTYKLVYSHNVCTFH